MIVTSKNGLKLEVSPADRWNIKDWIAFSKAIYFIKTHDIHMNAEDWRFAKATGMIE